MTGNEIIRVCFWTPEPDFGELVGRALGEGFELLFGDCGRVAGPDGEPGYDCVLLDLRDLCAVGESGRSTSSATGAPIIPLPSWSWWAMKIPP